MLAQLKEQTFWTVPKDRAGQGKVLGTEGVGTQGRTVNTSCADAVTHKALRSKAPKPKLKQDLSKMLSGKVLVLMRNDLT